MCLGGGLHCYNHFPELKFLCVWGGGGGLHFCTFIRLFLGCALMWVRNTTCQIRLQTSYFIPIAGLVTLHPPFFTRPLELGLGTVNPRFFAWPLGLELAILNPRFVVWLVELGLGTLNPLFVTWPSELGLGTVNPRFVAWLLELR